LARGGALARLASVDLDTNTCSQYPRTVQLRLDAADRLVELVEDRRGPVPAADAARAVLKLDAPVATGLARSLLAEAVEADARLRWSGDRVALAGAAGEELLLEAATY